MKNGFTTGSCAAAAAKAATRMIFENTDVNFVTIMTPANIEYRAKVEDIKRCENKCSCAVRKDSGDDPDITNNMMIYAEVSLIYDGADRVIIDGGEGIGRVTRPGLDRPVGDAAINSVPRRMIESEVRGLMEEYEFTGSAKVIIYAPEGRKVAERTFNQRLGIEGGISVIGTSGIVEPMSTRAIIETIKVELAQKKEMGERVAIVSPGNYGLEFMRSRYGYDLDKAVKSSNYIGETIDLARDTGFDEMLLVGHIGKLVKVAGGIMNTHSAEGDCRMEIMAAAAIKCGASCDTANKILDCFSTEEAYQCLIDAGIKDKCSRLLTEKIHANLKKRAKEMKIECIIYSNKFGLIGKSNDAERLLEK